MARNLQSKSFVQKKRRKILWKSISILLILVVALLICSWLMRLSFLTIKDVKVFGTDAEVTSSIHDAVMNNLENKYLGIFPYKNTLIYPKSEIASNIRDKFLRVMDVNISRDGLSNLRITVNEKTPKAVVCATLPNFEKDQVLISSDDPCYFADETGLLFEKSPSIEVSQYNVYFAPDLLVSADTKDYVGSYATSTSEFKLLQSFYNASREAGVNGNAMLIKENGEYEFYSGSTTIYFNSNQNILTELSNFVTFWKHMLETSTSQKHPTVFDYIDLRYDSNVFYKVIK